MWLEIRLSDGTEERDPFEILEALRWFLLEANDDRADRWERLQRLGDALDLAEELREVVERRIQHEAMGLHLGGA